MATHRRTTHQPARTMLALIATLALGACQGSGTPVATPSAATSSGTAAAALAADVAGKVAATVDRAGPDLGAAYALTAERLGDRSAVDELLDDRAGAVAALVDGLPPSPGADADGAAAARHADLRAAATGWVDAVDAVRDTLAARWSELAPLVEAWIADGGDAPGELLAVLAGDEQAANAFGDACAAYLDGYGLTADCFAHLTDGSPDLEVGASSGYEVTVGAVTLAYEHAGAEIDFLGEDANAAMGGGIILSLGAPPTVADPAGPLSDDQFAPIPDAIAWPDDLGGWYGALPVTVLDEGELVLSGDRSWRYVVLEGTERFALVDRPGGTPAMTGPIFEVVLWTATIEGEQIVAVSDGGPDMPYEEHLELARAVLDTVRVVG